MKKIIIFSLTILGILFLTSCAHSVNIDQCLPNEDKSGFWMGVWHGMTMQIAFICSLFNRDITIYDVNNTGLAYQFGYIGGLGICLKFLGWLIKTLINKD